MEPIEGAVAGLNGEFARNTPPSLIAPGRSNDGKRQERVCSTPFQRNKPEAVEDVTGLNRSWGIVGRAINGASECRRSNGVNWFVTVHDVVEMRLLVHASNSLSRTNEPAVCHNGNASVGHFVSLGRGVSQGVRKRAFRSY